MKWKVKILVSSSLCKQSPNLCSVILFLNFPFNDFYDEPDISNRYLLDIMKNFIFHIQFMK